VFVGVCGVGTIVGPLVPLDPEDCPPALFVALIIPAIIPAIAPAPATAATPIPYFFSS
ncbi:hypothetical protein SFB5_021G2, partial [Candidatus Arthromitus sp. SFB-5]